MRELQDGFGGSTYSPFEDGEEWELAQWLINNVTQWTTDEFLKLPVISHRMQLWPSYRSNYTFMKVIDKLPTKVELWVHDPVTCIRELMGNPAFDGEIVYTPEKVYTDQHGTTQQYDEMWMGDWWWETQCCLPSGSTITPVILVSDKTELSQFRGSKNAWPVYLSIGNLSKEVQHQPGCHASVLLGYLPLPLHLGNCLHPLVYVHWFKSLNHFDSSVGMFHATCSTQQCCPNTSIIPIHCLIQPCHLVPRYIDFSIFNWYQNHF
ncbi:hypothetical protein EDD17DRAFT_1778355 [Pisolithus thermaeus]|nr:hypothetical protein EDD17DRAFT_1778355 [Pisolithus thermaeus]